MRVNRACRPHARRERAGRCQAPSKSHRNMRSEHLRRCLAPTFSPIAPLPRSPVERGEGATGGGCRPDSVPRRAAFIHLGQAFPPGSCSLPGGLVRRGGRRGRATLDPPIRPCSAWGLPCPLRYRTGGALLPHPFTLTSGRIRRRSTLCGTFPRVAAAGRYPACCPPGVRTFLCPDGTANARLLQSRIQYTAFPSHCHGPDPGTRPTLNIGSGSLQGVSSSEATFCSHSTISQGIHSDVAIGVTRATLEILGIGYGFNMAGTFTPLKPGEPIGVVALSGPVDPRKLAEGIAVFESWGHPVLRAPNLQRRDGFLAGSDEDRTQGLRWVLDRGARVVVAARGGYGVTRLLPHLRMAEMAESGVTFVGFSDLSALLNGMVNAGGGPQIHGPMAAAGLRRPRNAERLRAVLYGECVGRALFRFGGDHVLRPGHAEGRAVGGNLAMLSSSIGTSYEPDFSGSVLFLEEVGEPLYRLDRMLTHLWGSGRLRSVKALICGSLRGCGPVRERADRWRELACERVPEDVPIVVDVPFGHGAVNLAFPIGARSPGRHRLGRDSME